MFSENLSTTLPVNRGINKPLMLPIDEIEIANKINNNGSFILHNKKNKGFLGLIIISFFTSDIHIQKNIRKVSTYTLN